MMFSMYLNQLITKIHVETDLRNSDNEFSVTSHKSKRDRSKVNHLIKIAKAPSLSDIQQINLQMRTLLIKLMIVIKCSFMDKSMFQLLLNLFKSTQQYQEISFQEEFPQYWEMYENLIKKNRVQLGLEKYYEDESKLQTWRQQFYIQNQILCLHKSIFTIDHSQISQMLQKNTRQLPLELNKNFDKLFYNYFNFAKNEGGIILIGVNAVFQDKDYKKQLQKYQEQKDHFKYTFKKPYIIEGIPCKQNKLQFTSSQGIIGSSFYKEQTDVKKQLQKILIQRKNLCKIENNQILTIKFVPVYQKNDLIQSPAKSFIIEVRLKFDIPKIRENSPIQTQQQQIQAQRIRKMAFQK